MNLKTISAFAVGPVGAAAVGFISVPFIAWMFSPEDVGRLNLLQVTLSFTLLLTVLGLDQAYVREYYESKNSPALLKSCFIPGFALLILCIAGSLPFSRELVIWLYDSNDITLHILTLSCIAIGYISRFLSLILRMQERGLAYSMSQLAPKIIQVVLLSIVFWYELERNFLTLLIISTAGMLVVVVIIGWNTRVEWINAAKAKLDIHELRSNLHFGLPLVLSGLAYWGLTASSTIVLRSYSNLGELGIYSITTSVAAVAAIFQSIFSIIWAPIIYKLISKGLEVERVDEIANQVLLVICIIFCIVGSVSWITDYLLPKNYESVKVLLMCAVGPPLMYMLSEITSIGINIKRRTIFNLWITLAALLTNILTSVLLVPYYGAGGAVVANAVSYFIFFIGRTELSSKIWFGLKRTKIYTYLTAFIFGSICMIIFVEHIGQYGSIFWFCTLILFVFVSKIEIYSIYRVYAVNVNNRSNVRG